MNEARKVVVRLLCRGLALALALACAFAAPARAQPYDPAYRWRTLETPHFRVHFHQGEDALAGEVAATAERAHESLVPVLGWAPRQRTEIVLSDDTDDANGSATPIPYDTIRLFATPPAELSELNAYRDWVSSLVFHEYVHILHLDHVEGIPDVLDRLFGKIATPNALTPRWMIEGLAVLHEADGSPGSEVGRNASAIHAMYVRSLALERPGFPRLDQASNPPLSFPLGTEAYLLGGRFLRFLQERSGDEAIRKYLARQAGWLWPYAPSIAGQPYFGANFPALWSEYARSEEARAREVVARVRSRPVTRFTRLTFEGGRAGWPRWTPDGSAIAYVRAGLDAHPALLRVAPDGKRAGAPIPLLAGSGLATGGGRVVLSRVEVWREFRLYSDLWSLDLASGAMRRITRGARAAEPALSADGATLAYVKRVGPGRLALVRRPADGSGAAQEEEKEEEETVFAEPGAEVFAPALSPDGRLVAFAVQANGHRDVVVQDRAGRRVKVTDDGAIDASPAFTADGCWLLFSSDRGGIYNLYAWPVEACLGGGAGCALRQVTNVETGAFQPAVSPDGKTIAFVTYSRDGYDVAVMAFRPEEWMEPEPAFDSAPASGGRYAQAERGSQDGRGAARPGSSARPEPVEGRGTEEAPPSDREESERGQVAAAGPGPTPSWADPSSARPYSPWRTVWPRWWLPVAGSDPDGTILGAMTGGQDVLGRHTWALQGWRGLASRENGYAASYLGGWSWPAVDLSSSRFVERARAGDGLRAIWTPLDAGLDFTFTRMEWSALVRAGWRGTFRDVLGAGGKASSPEDLRTRDGFGSELTLLARWSDARRYVRSISPEEGRTVALAGGVSLPELGSDYRLARGRASVAQYLRVPFTRHVVLALRAAGGAADGSLGASAPFTLGGPAQIDPLSLVMGTGMGGTGASADELRGYPLEWFEGTGFALANAELRFPLLRPQLGYSTWPVYLRRIHGALFADLGETFDLPGTLPFAGHRFRWDDLRLGAGAELRLELSLGYSIVTDLRLGAAAALGRPFRGEDREPGVSAFTGYAILGGGF